MSGDNNITNIGLINSPVEPRCSLYLPSVKTWNEHIRRNTFVKDHTAVPLPTLVRDHSMWNSEALFSPQNGAPNSSNEQQNPSQNEIVGGISEVNNGDNQSTTLKKAFEMASKTRDMLSKLDGWKALSIKPYPTSLLPQSTAPVSGGYMIKSSSQFTTLDAKSDEAKNILQNIKDMAQILCPPEYGGVSHFRFMNEQNQNPGQYDNVARSSYASIETTSYEDSRSNSYIQNKIMDSTSPIVSNYQLTNQSACISSSRINIVGRPSMHLSSYSANNSLGTSAPSAISAASMATDKMKVQSQNLDSYSSNDETQKQSFVKMKALYEDLMSKWNSNQQKGREANTTDSLYEDFDDGNFSLTATHSTPISSSFQTFDQGDSLDQFSSNTFADKNSYFSNPRDKNQDEWEKDTQDFLRKLNSKPGTARRDFTSSSRQACKSRPEGDRIDHYDDDEMYNTRSASNCSSFSFDRSKTRRPDFNVNETIKDTNRDYSKTASRVDRFERLDVRSQRSMNPVSPRDSSRETSKHKEPNAKNVYQKLYFYDDGSHGCTECGLTGMKLSSYLDHLLSQDHINKMTDLPASWSDTKFDESLLSKKTSEKVLAIRGTDAIYPVTAGFYCRPCKEYFHNKNMMMQHLASKNHDNECYFYNKSHKRQCDTNDLIPAKKFKVNPNVNPAAKLSKVTTTPSSLTSAKGPPTKTQPSTKRDFKQTLPQTKQNAKVSVKLNPNMNSKMAPKPLLQSVSGGKGDNHEGKIKSDGLSESKVQIEVKANCEDDSDVDFVELDEWTEDG